MINSPVHQLSVRRSCICHASEIVPEVLANIAAAVRAAACQPRPEDRAEASPRSRAARAERAHTRRPKR